MQNAIAHFDVDQNLKSYLEFQTYPFSLSPNYFPQIENATSLELVSIKSQSQINEEVLHHLPNLKMIITRTVGTNHVDQELCQKRNIKIATLPNYGSQVVAEHALGLLLCGARNIVFANKDCQNGQFAYQNFLGSSLFGKTIGVIGMGKIGQALTKLLQPFGMQVLAYDIYQDQKIAQQLGFSYKPLKQLLKTADFIVICASLNGETQHLLNLETLALIKEGAVLVNIARGEIIDTKALLKYHTKFKAICLDVVDNEAHFDKTNQLLSLKNIVLTPHIAFYSDKTIKTIGEQTTLLVKQFIKDHTL
ncbi:hypothetical protein GYA49_04190 [Candidatus Beckwithbacteria bacterium]|nr:hypothetical protein [Candidatus Beckwithbacteria bacterium]